jgi:predicted phosphodiesterase
MKIIALGDTHGRSTWKSIVAENTFDKIIFIGDYFDNHDGISADEQISNFGEILTYKLQHPNQVILLIGNHDFHYLKHSNETYKGYQKEHHVEIEEMLDFALQNNLLQMCFKHQHFLFTHAGVTNTWLSNNAYDAMIPIDTFINQLFMQNPKAFSFTIGHNYSPNGDDVSQTPIWVRPNSLFDDAFAGYVQIVGHTPKSRLKILHQKIVLLDTLNKSGEFLCIDEGELQVMKVKELAGSSIDTKSKE